MKGTQTYRYCSQHNRDHRTSQVQGAESASSSLKKHAAEAGWIDRRLALLTPAPSTDRLDLLSLLTVRSSYLCQSIGVCSQLMPSSCMHCDMQSRVRWEILLHSRVCHSGVHAPTLSFPVPRATGNAKCESVQLFRRARYCRPMPVRMFPCREVALYTLAMQGRSSALWANSPACP